MSNIQTAFEKGKAFIPFITCGDPDIATTEKVVRAAAANGADLIELGIPFSDPVAEGAVLQNANVRALFGGVTTDKIFEMVKRLRNDVTVPMIFVTYANVVFSYGTDRFLAACGKIGIDGVRLPDVPFEEKEDFLPICNKYGVALISALAPASDNRIAMICREAEGFLYMDFGMTESKAQGETTTDFSALVSAARRNTDIPCTIGFDTPTEEQLAELALVSDGIVVNTAVAKLLEQYGKNAAEAVGEYVKSMKNVILKAT